MDDAIANKLEQRLGRLHARQRLGIEKDHEAQIFGQGINFFHIENWYSIHALIRTVLKLGGIFWRGQSNAGRVQVRHNYIRLQRLPRAFNNFTLLHISDLHVDMNEGAMRCLEELLPGLAYDICAITGDYRGATFGPFDDALEGMKRLRSHLGKMVYGVLGNHDTVRMVPGLEEMGIRICSTSANLSPGVARASIWPVSTMRIITGSIISKKQPPPSRPTPFLFCCPTLPRFIATPPMLDLTCC